jgi:hypothetical protein
VLGSAWRTAFQPGTCAERPAPSSAGKILGADPFGLQVTTRFWRAIVHAAEAARWGGLAWSGLAAALVAGLLLATLAALPASNSVRVPIAAYPASSGGWLDRLNAWRATTGLAKLTESSTWSQGDYNHAVYMVKNDLVTHYETPGVPYYTSSGDTAARDGNIEVNSTTSMSDEQAVDWWMGAPFHAMNMMDPRLAQTGFGSYRQVKSGWQAGFALDTIRGNSFTGGTYPVFWPGNGVTEPLTKYSGNEFPDPLQACSGYSSPAGLPVFIEVGGNVRTTASSTHSFTGNGVALAHCVIDSNNAAVGSYLFARGGVIVIPRQPLQAGVKYVVSLTVNSKPYTWSFTVGPSLLPAFAVTGVSPINGPAGGGTSVTISGTGFNNGVTGVNFGTTPAASFSVINETTITAVSPAHVAGTVDVTVTTAAGATDTVRRDQYTFGVCTSATASAGPASPSTAGTLVTVTGSATGCANPQYEFWLMYPNGTWHMLQGFGSATWSWDTSKFAPGTYTIHVWANNSGDAQTAYEAFGSATYIVLKNVCTSAGLTLTGLASRPAGSTVDFTAASGGCLNPAYEYWVGDSKGRWTLKRPFSSDPTWTWDTSGLAPGVYQVHVWANNAGDSTAKWEVYASSTVTLTGCTSATLIPTNPSTPAGATATATAASSGCLNPQYEFWVMYPNGTWHLAQGFGSATFSWNTSGLAQGTYVVHVWANHLGAPTTTYQAYGSATITLTGCVSAATNPISGSAIVGTPMTFTAGATGCPNPVYSPWLQFPDGSWHQLQPFGPGNSWTWNTAGLPKGTYVLHVWANNQGSYYGAYETFGSATYVLS